jgi:hypothetical protein
MPSQSVIPWYSPSDRYRSSIVQLLMRKGDVAAEAAARSKESWARALGNIGQIAGGAVQQIQQQKDQKKREEMFGEAMQSWDPANPQEFYRKAAVAFGADFALSGLKALTALEESKRKAEPDPKLLQAKAEFIGRLWKEAPDFVRQNWAGIAASVPEVTPLHGIPVGPEWNEEQYAPILEALAPKPPETRFQPVTTAAGIQPFDPSKGTLGDVIGQPPAPKPEKTLADLEAEAAARARGTRAGAPPEGPKGTWTTMEDAEGNPVLFNTTTQEVKPFPAGVRPKPGTTEANRIAASVAALEVSRAVRDYIDKNRKVLGPLTGRYKTLGAAVGAADPIALRLMGELKSYAALQPQIHGFRNIQFVRDIETQIANIRMDPDALIAGIEGIDAAAKAVSSRGRGQNAEPEPAPTENKPKAVNPQTGEVVYWDGTRWVK